MTTWSSNVPSEAGIYWLRFPEDRRRRRRRRYKPGYVYLAKYTLNEYGNRPHVDLFDPHWWMTSSLIEVKELPKGCLWMGPVRVPEPPSK